MGFQRFYLIAGAFFCVKLVGEGYAVSFRLGAPGDAGMVPLSLREIAKGGKKMIQLAALKQVSSFFQRSHPELRGSQIPGSRRSQAEAHRCGMADRSEVWQRGGVYRWFMQCLKKAQKTLV